MIYENENWTNEIKRLGFEAVKEIFEKINNNIKKNENSFYYFGDDFENKCRIYIRNKIDLLRTEEMINHFSKETIMKKFTNGIKKIENIPLLKSFNMLPKIYLKISRTNKLNEKMKKEKIYINEYDFKYLEISLYTHERLFKSFEKYKTLLGNLKTYFYEKTFLEFMQYCKKNNIHLYYVSNKYHNKNWKLIEKKEKITEETFIFFNNLYEEIVVEEYKKSTLHKYEGYKIIEIFLKKINELKKISNEFGILKIDVRKQKKIIKAFLDYINKNLKLLNENVENLSAKINSVSA